MKVNLTHNALGQHPKMSFDSDVLIIGAGPAGLAFATALADAGFSATLLEQQARSAIEQPVEDGRDIALTHRAHRIMSALGMWAHLPADQVAPLREARVLNGNSADTLRFASGSAGDEVLGWLVPNHCIRRAAAQAALARPAVQLLCDARVQALQLNDAEGAARVTLANGRSLRAPLVVSADSRFSQTRRMAGIGTSMRDFGRSVVVGRVAHARENDGIAWECFRHGNTLALLPMNDRQCSAVVTVASDQAQEWLGLSDAEFAARIEAQSGGRLGAMQAAGARHHYPLVGVYAHRFVAPRFALVGDAAVGMHPVTAHGYNFGLYGVEVLVRELQRARRSKIDIGSRLVLQRYESEHRRTTLPVYWGTNAVVSLFTDDRPAAQWLRRAVLTASEHAPILSGLVKGAITRQLTGHAGARAFP